MGGQYYNGPSRDRYQCGELGCFGSGYELLESPCKCGSEPPGSISHGGNIVVIVVVPVVVVIVVVVIVVEVVVILVVVVVSVVVVLESKKV